MRLQDEGDEEPKRLGSTPCNSLGAEEAAGLEEPLSRILGIQDNARSLIQGDGDALLSRTDVRNEAISGKDASTDVVVRRHRLSARTKFDLVFDTGLFVAFAIAYAEDFTGLSLHEWFGIAFGVALLFHFSLHWEWVVRTTKGMLTTSGRRRVMWLVNLALLGDLMLCIGSGILITGWRVFGVVFNSNTFWNNLHGTTAGVAIALIGIHIGLDWRWIANASRRMTRRSPRRVGGTINED